MIPRPIDQITGSDIEGLVVNAMREGLRLDYKQCAIGNSDADKREFVRDVCALANGDGGDIILGVREEEGVAVEITGLGSIDLDQEILRLTAIIRSGLDPVLPGTQFKPSTTSDGKTTLVIRVPRSWLGPHRVTTLKDYQFYTRTGAGKHPMSIDELRAAFGQQDMLGERVSEFRERRLAVLRSPYQAVPLINFQALTFVHLMPLAAAAKRSRVTFKNYDLLSKIGAASLGSHSPVHNADGFLLYASSGEGDGRAIGYVQLFNDGSVEFAILLPYRDGANRFSSVQIPERIISFYRSVSEFYASQALPPPVAAMLSIIGADQVVFSAPRAFDDDGARLRIPILKCGDTLIESFELPPHTALRPMFDHLWQAYGFSHCPHYNSAGDWAPRR